EKSHLRRTIDARPDPRAYFSVGKRRRRLASSLAWGTSSASRQRSPRKSKRRTPLAMVAVLHQNPRSGRDKVPRMRDVIRKCGDVVLGAIAPLWARWLLAHAAT